MTSTRCALEGLCREVNEKMPFAGLAVLASPKERPKVRFVWKWDMSIILNKKDMKKFLEKMLTLYKIKTRRRIKKKHNKSNY